jgi:hypothetical protein
MTRGHIPVWLSACVPVLVGALVMVGSRAPLARWGGHLGAGAVGLALNAVLVMTAARWRVLGVGAAGIVFATSGPRWRYLLALLYLATAVATWLRFDPLPPAPFVEDIVVKAFAFTPVIGIAGVLSLGLLIVAPLLDGRLDRDSRPAAVALIGYFFGSLVAVRFREFPVPLLGVGPSATLGAFVGFAALTAGRASRPGSSAGCM